MSTAAQTIAYWNTFTNRPAWGSIRVPAEVAGLFPKYVGLKPNYDGTEAYATLTFRDGAHTGPVNERAIKRYRKFVQVCRDNGIEVVKPFDVCVNQYDDVDAVLAALAEEEARA